MKVSREILELIPYKPGKPISETKREYGVSKVIKLASNENPLGPSPKAVTAMKRSLQDLHRYPDPSSFELIQALSSEWSVDAKKIAVGNGSNETIDLLIRIFCEPGEAILTSEAAFVAYQVCAQAARVNRIFVPMASGYKTDLKAMAQFLETSPDAKNVRLVFIPNPNNPTGTYVNKKEIEAFLKIAGRRKDLYVVFDEAYNEYVRAKDYVSAQTFMARYPNVIVSRTLSKAYGLAGVRVGVILAPEEVVELVNRVRNPFNVNTLAQVAATAALKDHRFIQRSVKLAWQGLDYFYDQFTKLHIPYTESQGNFVMFDTLRDVTQVHVALLKRGVILRPIQNYGFKTHMRLSTGLASENKIAIQKLKEVFKEIEPL